ncbi:LacI family transcriptional regulator [Arthrobacter ginsengisoli]|uniref:LacI family transcriptional regulator n=1 Tax=Arthrobacter ginsengisoli TaxID=1356565 RepID=A0ABU1UHR6_9MICC|nr:LacI family DNA-binding transcriptional regulator [Arthrobacter ginsengisoli]MDR7084718.1 LacI family transcriptional regulator [Arthrobacter ginsengisoli]
MKSIDRPTMKDVALRAHVDISVVSRVLSQDPRLSVTAATRARVENAVRELSYSPNRSARALRTSKSGLLTFVLPQIANPLYLRMVSGAVQKAKDLGYQLVVAELTHAAEQLREYQASGIDGILLATGGLDEDQLGEWMEGQMPVVVVNRTLENSENWSSVDYPRAATLAADHLGSLGHRHVMVLTGPEKLPGWSARSDAFRAVLGDHETVEIRASGLYADQGYAAAAEILARRQGETAVFVTSMMLAVGLLKGLRESGVSVPEDLSVIALHDDDLANYVSPPLTTVALPMYQLGQLSVAQLVNMIDDKKEGPIVVTDPPQLVVRGSTGPPGER